MSKKFISPESFYSDSALLGKKIYDSKFRPDFILGVWRGGSVPALVIDEVFRYYGYRSDNIAIRTSRYTGIGQATEEVKVHSLDYLRSTLKPNQSILIVDDIFDSGKSLKAIKDAISNLRYSEIRIATVYYKSGNNTQDFEPNYYVRITNDWVVFPHEFEGLNMEEKDHKPWF